MTSSTAARQLRVDLHTHTRLSRDGWTSPAELVRRARRAGLDRIAVTDHNEIDNAFAAQAIAPELVIVGEEMDCAGGCDLIGLYLTHRIPPGLSVEETAAEIRAQGGVVYAPHPFAYLRDARARAERVLAVADIAEGFNSRAFAPAWNRLARAAARERGLAIAAGSDGHFPWEIGGTYSFMPAFSDGAELRAAAPHATIPDGLKTRAYVHACSFGLMLLRGRRRHAGERYDLAPA
jgi:predicted metal-dependent phosphoesterase TrpH